MRSSSLLYVLCLTASLAAQARWRATDVLQYVTGPIAWDAARNVAWHVGVVDGVMQTAAFDGTTWTVLATSSPPAREAHGLAFDPVRARLVLFGGRDLARTQVFGDTWEFDGGNWQLVASTGPAARCLFPMTWHAGRNVVTLACGTSSPNTPWGTALADVWEWNGSTWSRRAGLRDGRIAPALGHDPVRNELVLCGGHAVVGSPTQPMPVSFDETWTLGGAAPSWSLRATSVSAGRRSTAVLTFDPARGRLQLLGGSDLGGGGPDPLSGDAAPIAATMEWTGSDWSAVSALPYFGVALGAAIDPRSGDLIAFGGDWLLERGDATWRRAASLAWSRASDGTPRSLGAIAADESRARLVGLEAVGDFAAGYRTFEWDGSAFAQRADASALAITRFAVLAWHAGSQRCVALGSTPTSTFGNETWLWDGAQWVDANPAQRPTPRYAAALAPHPDRGALVLFGGWGPGPFGGSIALDDTWIWDGVTWAQAMPTQSPTPRAAAAITFDSRRRLVVLYGGVGASVLGDVWTFDGLQWSADTAPPTSPLLEPSLCDDRARDRLMLTGRANSSTLDRETWEFDGSVWRHVASGDPRSSTVAPQSIPLVYDADAERVFACFERAVWTWQTSQPAWAVPYGVACATSLGVPSLTTHNRPWLGDFLRGSFGPIPAGSPAGIFIGTSNAQWAGNSLPFSLAAFGAPGCVVYAEPILLLIPPFGATIRAWTLQLPADPRLAGAHLYLQALALDPLANAFGLATSEGLDLRLGIR